jgi:hypothetical protein
LWGDGRKVLGNPSSSSTAVLKCENGKMRPAETVPGRGEGIKENGGEGKFNYDIL